MKVHRLSTCSKDVYDGAEVHPRRCRRRAVVMRGGQTYCAQHDPKKSTPTRTRTGKPRRGSRV